MAFPWTVTTINYPVKVYPWRATNLSNLHMNFMHFHVKDAIVVLN